MRASTPSSAPTFLAILAEIGGAILGGLLVAVALAYGVGFLLIGSDLGMGVLSLQVFAGVIGFGVGGGLGAALAGRLLGQGGRWLLAVILGSLTGVAVVLVMRLLNLGGLFGILGVGAPLTIAAAVLGYNLRRRP